MAFAAFQFEMAAEVEGGGTVLEHMQAVQRQTGEAPAMLLAAPPLPSGCEELWGIFNELHSCRGYVAMSGPMRITYADIDAFQRVADVKLSPWERRAIREADAAFLDDWATRNPAK